MKKQKKPIILVLGLAILCGAVAFMNKSTSDSSDKPEQQQPAAAPAATEKKADVASNVANQMKDVKKVSAKPKMMPHRGGPMGDTPLILKITMAPQKPKMNESSTAAQWYTKDSAHNKPNN